MTKTLLVGLTFIFSASSYAVETTKPLEDYSATYHIYKIKDGQKSLLTSASSLVKVNVETPVKIERSIGSDLTLASEGFEIITEISNKNSKEQWDMKGTVTAVDTATVADNKEWSKVTSETIGFRHSMLLEKGKTTEFTSNFEQGGVKYLLEGSVTRLK